MTEGIKNNNGTFESGLDNIAEELSWVKKQIKRELSELQKDVHESKIKETFFEKKENTVTYHMDLVKQYLQSCVQKDEFQINSAVIMAVQIALESKGYEVGKIDGLLKRNSGKESNTEKAIKKFQKENGLRIDGVPGKNTIKKILEKLGNVPVEPKKPEKKEDKKEDKKESPKGPSEKTKGESTNTEPKKPEKKPEKKTVEKPTETKENKNKKEYWESANILVGPKLKATKRKEVGGIGSSIMHGIQGYDTRSFGFSNMAGKGSGIADDSRFDEENGKIYEDFILPRAELIDYCKSHNIKSFMFYFGGNESTPAQQKAALENIERWGNYLEKGGIQPVLCTCIGENIKQHKNSAGDYYVKEYNKAIREMQEKHGWPLIDFVKIDQPDVFRPNDGWHPGTTGYKRMGTKIEQCFSSAEK